MTEAAEPYPAGTVLSFEAVQHSLTGRPWVTRPGDTVSQAQIVAEFGLSPLLARLLETRGVAVADVGRHLAPRLRDWMPDPDVLIDMPKAAGRIWQAMQSREQIAVFADYDVDGATSAACLIHYLRAFDQELILYVPDRLKEGYGPTPEAFQLLASRGVKLIITVDCGTAARDALNEARALGVDVVVLDHHLTQGDVPAAAAIVNPNRPDCPSGLGDLAGVGVTFMLLVALNRLARAEGAFAARPEPDLRHWLDLVAMGTICDVSPLRGLNRAFVANGLKELSRMARPGLKALAEAAGRPRLASAEDVGFVIGPRLNAGGRIGVAAQATQLLVTSDDLEALDLATRLDATNAERRRIEQAALLEAEGQAAHQDNRAVVVVAGNWSPGIVGIVAGRLKDRLYRPAIVIGWDGVAPGEAKGSGRSLPGVNLGDALHAAHESGLLLAGGGHAMAGGLSIVREQISAFHDFIDQHLAADVATARLAAQAMVIDAAVAVHGLDLAFLDSLEPLAPFGASNPSPVFCLPRVELTFAAKAGDSHVRCTLANGGKGLKGIAFKCLNSPLGEALLARDRRLDLVVRLQRNVWNGRESLEVEILDGAFSK